MFALFSQAKLYQQPQLEQRCLQFIEKNAKDLFTKFVNDWTDLKLVDIVSMLKSDRLRVDEYTIFDACMKWGTCECKRQNLEVNVENLRKVMRKILAEIRFPCMNQEEFAIKVMNTNILSKDEALAVLMYWVSNRKLPCEGFNCKPRRDKKVRLQQWLQC